MFCELLNEWLCERKVQAAIRVSLGFRPFADEEHEQTNVIYHVLKTIESFLDENFASLDGKEVWEDPVFYLFSNKDK